MNRALLVLFVLLVVLSPLPLASNRDWSWSICALYVSALTLFWLLLSLRTPGSVHRLPGAWQTVFFLAVLGWAGLQVVSWTPPSWHHPLWEMMGQVLAVESAGAISLVTDETKIAVMRLSSYVLTFVLAVQLGRDARAARALFACISVAGLVYAIFGLYAYWSGADLSWLFGDRSLAHDVRSTFINRNHFATWIGLAILCAIVLFYQRVSVPNVTPYSMPQDRPARVEEFVLKAWKPMAALLLMVTALILTHSRGGFLSTLAAVVLLLYLLDNRGSQRRALSRISIGVAVAVASISFYLTSEVLLDRINRTDITQEERLAVYANVNQAIRDNPVLGFGYGTFSESFRLYDRNENTVHYDRAHNTWLENAFELGVPAALLLYLAIGGVAVSCLRGVNRRHRDWIYPATGVAASLLVGLHALVDFSLQIPAVAILYASIMGVSFSQSHSTRRNE